MVPTLSSSPSSRLSPILSPSPFSVFLRLFLFFGNHIETPYVPPLSQAADVCNGNSRHRGKKLPRPDGKGAVSDGGKKSGTRGGSAEGGRGEEMGAEGQPSITSLFTDFSAGRHVDICNYRTEAAAVFIRDLNDDF